MRHIVLVDVPLTWADYQQHVGRAVRMCVHHALEPEQQTVQVWALCGQLPGASLERQLCHSLDIHPVQAEELACSFETAGARGLSTPAVAELLAAVGLSNDEKAECLKAIKRAGLLQTEEDRSAVPVSTADEEQWARLYESCERLPPAVGALVDTAIETGHFA